MTTTSRVFGAGENDFAAGEETSCARFGIGVTEVGFVVVSVELHARWLVDDFCVGVVVHVVEETVAVTFGCMVFLVGLVDWAEARRERVRMMVPLIAWA